MNSQYPEILFLPAADANMKIQCIANIVKKHFYLGERLLLFAANPQAADYLDKLLWRYPPESFIPHVIAQESCREHVAITLANKNINQAAVAFNLCPHLCPDMKTFKIIYEFLDKTDSNKEEFSKKKMVIYQESSSFVKTL